MSKHTPGPWDYDTDDLGTWINAAGWPQPIAKMGKCTHFETQANARLIAAAPELLEACKALQAEASARGCGLRIADEAIAKAEGKQP